MWRMYILLHVSEAKGRQALVGLRELSQATDTTGKLGQKDVKTISQDNQVLQWQQ